MDERGSTTARSRATLRLGVVPLLLGLVGVPLLVVGSLIVQDLREADQQRATISEIVPIAERRISAIRLQAALSDERTWSIAAVGVEQFGVDSQLVEDVIGVDIEERYAQSVRTTDSLTGDWPEIHADLEDLRSTRTDNLDTAARYQTLMVTVEATGADAARQLQRRALPLSAGDDLLRALAITEAAADAQLAVNGQFVSSIASRFVESTGDPETELQALIENRRAYTQANDTLDAVGVSDPLAEKLTGIREAAAEKNLLRSVDNQIERALAEGLDAQPGEVWTVAINDLAELETFLVAAESSNTSWVDLTRAAGNELIAVAAERGDLASETISRARLLLIMTGIVTLVATVAVALVFSHSVRRLAKAAQSLRDGETERFHPTGPREVYLAGEALSEASSNIRLIRRQATVLAEGELTHPDLEQTVPGQLGATLKRVVDTLLTSIHAREAAQADVLWQASHDGLTGLPNRSSAMETIEARLASEQSQPIAVLEVDLDGFKDVNDGHGHSAGDEVLVEVAKRLAQHCRSADVVCRLGGDEFVMILDGPITQRVAGEVAQRMLTSIGGPMKLSTGALVSISACIGIAISDADSTVSALVKHADLAAYEAKNTGRNRFAYCTEELLDENHRTAQLNSEILDAIEGGELRLEYQPIVDVSGQLNSVEALIRWDHPVHGLITPEYFIPIAERSDLIIEIDRWVVEAAAQQLANWSTLENGMADLAITVNISTRHLNAASAVEDILGPLRELEIDPALLSVEITETALVQDTDEARMTLEALRANGIRIAIDDFGTGHSSITQLRVLPIDFIKIDRSFTEHVTNPGSFDAALVQLIIDTAHLLGAQIITEGVESIEQADAAIRMGTDALQGWLFSPSVRPEQIPELLDRQRLEPSRLN